MKVHVIRDHAQSNQPTHLWIMVLDSVLHFFEKFIGFKKNHFRKAMVIFVHVNQVPVSVLLLIREY